MEFLWLVVFVVCGVLIFFFLTGYRVTATSLMQVSFL